MAVDITVPDFDFSSFYYGEILDALIVYKRQNIPEISNESPFEPGIQLLRAFALVGHLNNTLLDMTANETMLPTAKLRDSVVNLLALIGYIPHANIPSTGVVRAQLTKGYSAATLIVTDNALFGTRRKAETPPILFESDAALTVERTDELAECHRVDFTLPSVVWTDNTVAANTDSSTFTLLGAPGGPQDGDSFYIAHVNVMSDTIEFEGLVPIDFGDDQGDTDALTREVWWEYFDNDVEDAAPDSVTNQGTDLRFVINDLLGGSEPAPPGLYVTITVNSTGLQEERAAFHDGTNNYVDSSGFLGQTSPSTDAGDYTVGIYWHRITGITDTTEATIPVVAEDFATGDTVVTTFTSGVNTTNPTLLQFRLDPVSRVDFKYLSGAVAKTATWKPGDVLSGDAALGTTVDPETGLATLVATSTPDAGTITVDYTREAQPFQQDGSVSFAVPKTDIDDWQDGRLNEIFATTSPIDYLSAGVPTSNGLWLRCRVIFGLNAVPSTGLVCDRVKWDQGGMYIAIPVTQGRTFSGEVAGSGDGSADQSYTLLNSPVIDGSVLAIVDDDSWVQVDDFSASDSTDEHYTVRIDSDGIGVIGFGDGTNGKAPPAGTNNIVSEYRVGGADDGNVGADQIKVNRSGLSRIKRITNPRAAAGWLQQEGASDETLEKLKRDGVASVRVLERAVTVSDIETLAVAWTYPLNNQQPYSRANAIENGFGPNTIKLLVVPIGGTVPSPVAQREATDDYFNGNLDEGGDEPGVLVVNHELTTFDYTPVVIDITATVTGGNLETIETALEGLIAPEALLADGVTYRWKFGATVTLSKLNSTIFQADSDVEDVSITVPAADVGLAVDELPKLGTLSITVLPPT